MEDVIEEIANKFKIKLTKARVAILKILIESEKPLCFNEIKEVLELKMDKATFYRNICFFEEHNMLNKFESNDRKWYYELKNRKDHAHFICDECFKISCVDFEIPGVIEDNSVHDIVLKGTCKDCKEE